MRCHSKEEERETGNVWGYWLRKLQVVAAGSVFHLGGQ